MNVGEMYQDIAGNIIGIVEKREKYVIIQWLHVPSDQILPGWLGVLANQANDDFWKIMEK